MNFNLENIVRDNVKNLVPYSSARREFDNYGDGSAQIFLDANENSFGSPLGENYHRYPDPMQTEIKEKIAARNDITPEMIFVGNGSDEAIDLLIRIFCRPQKDNILICPPTYGMYEVAAAVNDVEVKRAALNDNFDLDCEAIKRAIDSETKIIFICSPNNPTGNSLARLEIFNLLRYFNGIVAVDEAYVHFSRQESFVPLIEKFPNLIVLQTFSKAWGLAGLRVGSAFASPEIIALFNKIKPPYNVSEVAQRALLEVFEKSTDFAASVLNIINERERLIEKLNRMPFVEKIYPSDANFLLVKVKNAEKIYRFLLGEKIVVRNRNNIELCAGCLRITVGTPPENDKLLEALAKNL